MQICGGILAVVGVVVVVDDAAVVVAVHVVLLLTTLAMDIDLAMSLSLVGSKILWSRRPLVVGQ